MANSDESEVARLGRLRRNATYRAKNRAALSAKAIQWRKDNPEKAAHTIKAATASAAVIRRAGAADRKAKRDAEREARKIANKDARAAYMREAQKKYRLKYPDRVRARNRLYHKDNPDFKRVSQAKRRALELASLEACYTTNDVKRLMRSQKGLCMYCGTDVRTRYHVDHIMPLALGGSNGRHNIQVLSVIGML